MHFSVTTIENQRTQIAKLEQQLIDEERRASRLQIAAQEETCKLEKRCTDLEIERSTIESRLRQLEIEMSQAVRDKNGVPVLLFPLRAVLLVGASERDHLKVAHLTKFFFHFLMTFLLLY